MGSSSSKTRRIGGETTASLSSSSSSSSSSPSSSYSSSVVAGSSAGNSRRREKSSKTRRIFGSSCLGGSSSSRAYDTDDEHEVSDHCDEVRGPRIRSTESESDEVKVEHYQTVKLDGSEEVPRVSSNIELGDWTHASRTDNVTRVGGSSSQSLSGRSFNNSSRFLSRFSFVPESVSFRLSRAASVGSSRAYPSSPTSFAVSGAEDDLHLRRGSYGLINRTENQQIDSVNSSCPSSSSARNDDSIINLMRNDAVSSPLSTSLQRNRVISAQGLADDSERIRPDDGLTPFGSRMDIGGLNSRLGDHQNGTREPVDRNVRFSRTLSVGRLRDRVLRRSSFSDMTLSPSQNQGTTSTNENPVNSLISSPYPLPSTRNPFHTNQNNDEISHLREARRHDLLEHRSNFLERRRRIRSQVRALQRLGSRFENLSGHDRYCILSGQHRTGRCSCQTSTRDSNSNDDGVARGSISRIVMLAEALFEVLDEIHQQSVALSSRPSVSSIGSVPAPSEVVESLPVRVYSKNTKVLCEDVAQCYICLVEYDEGDDVRILPCHHEFHKKCIDKWLKEIHRVCPLCRGDICRLDSSSVER